MFYFLRNKIISLAVILFLTAGFALLVNALPVNKANAIEERIEEQVEDLLSRMTLEEKIGQMVQAERSSASPADVRDYFLGSILSGGGSTPTPNTVQAWVDMYDAYQRAALSTRLGIPIIYGVDAVHGHNNVYGATIFPHNIGIGAANDPALTEEIGRIVAKEVRATGPNWTFAPALSVPRNDRWGRTYEGFGEDPELVGILGKHYVLGFQGTDARGEHIVACVKHWVGDGGTFNGIDQGNTICSEAELRAVHIAPYLPALEAGVKTVMVSFSSWNGVKCHASKYLITDILKNELGFKGFVVSDWDGIKQISFNFAKAVEISVNAGIDMFMIPYDWKQFISTLKTLVDKGSVPMSRIDDAVRRILRVKFTSGLFEQPFADRSLSAAFGSAAHRATAREAVRKSLVLLKNNGILPLSKDTARIFVAGKNADNIGHQCGGWTITWQGGSGNITPGTTILQGIQDAVSPGTAVTFSEDGTGAAGHDVAIVIIGETPYAEGQGDVTDLSLDHEDCAVLDRVKEAGIPTVVIMVSGRPLLVTDRLEEWDAFVAAWLPGSEGAGVADVIFGDYDFTGKLPCTWPADNTQVGMNVGDDDYNPLFPFGYGLTYAETATVPAETMVTTAP